MWQSISSSVYSLWPFATKCPDAMPVCVCVCSCGVCSMSAPMRRVAVARCCADGAPLRRVDAAVKSCRRSEERINWEFGKPTPLLLQPLTISLDLAVSTSALLPTHYISFPPPSRSWHSIIQSWHCDRSICPVNADTMTAFNRAEIWDSQPRRPTRSKYPEVWGLKFARTFVAQ